MGDARHPDSGLQGHTIRLPASSWGVMSTRVHLLAEGIRAILAAPCGRGELALLASVLAYYHTRALARLMRRPKPRRPPEDRWLTPSETATLMGVSRKWLHRRRDKLPFIHPLPGGGRGWRASLRELRAHMARRSS